MSLEVDRIICGDSRQVLKSIPNDSIDLIFTSPPYNFNRDYDKYDDDIPLTRYFNNLFTVFKECVRVTKFGGRIVVNIQPLWSKNIPTHHIISNFFIENNMIWRGEILWEKNNFNCGYTTWGSWKSPSSPYLRCSWEFLEIFCKGTVKHVGDPRNADITTNEFKEWVYAKWNIPPEQKMVKKYGHPAMFPEELARRVLKLFTFRGDVVLDPFNGVGTTTKVAKQLGRKYIGIDVSERYTKIARNRTMTLEDEW